MDQTQTDQKVEGYIASVLVYNVMMYVGNGYAVELETRYDAQKRINLHKISDYSKLDEGWNGYNARKFTDDALRIFRDTINAIDRQPEISPTGRNSLYMQFTFEDNTMVSYELFTNRMDEVVIPYGDYSLMTDRSYNDDFSAMINKRVKEIDGSMFQRENQ
ncbi:MAG: hypothetical protein II133_00320 [Lachnospiraceae bacterium]|nr:hypothetical protein [Lachnospiraceae bacterium]